MIERFLALRDSHSYPYPAGLGSETCGYEGIKGRENKGPPLLPALQGL